MRKITVSKRRREWTDKWETLGLIALHAFPTLYCGSDALEPGTSAAIIFDAYRTGLEQTLAAMPRWQRGAITLFWPAMAVMWSVVLTAVNGRFVAARYGRGVFAQFADQMRLAFRHGVLPAAYYRHELHDADKRARAHELIPRGYLKMGGRLYKSIYKDRPVRKRRSAILNDKLAMHEFLQARQLATARLFAVASGGELVWVDTETAALPEIDLFVKPQRGNGGMWTERWTFREQSFHNGRSALSAEALENHLKRQSRKRTLLVFECVYNHHEIATISGGGLSTLRIYTLVNEAGAVEHVFSMLRMSRDAHEFVDNVCRGGIAAMVAPETGILNCATDTGVLARTGWLGRHPGTGGAIEGRHVPFWREAVELALDAHRKLEGPLIVGWDIAITERGPILIEGNKSPDIEIEQRLSGPWGNSRFGQLLAHYLTVEGMDLEDHMPDIGDGPGRH
jgi:hypothetical protein